MLMDMSPNHTEVLHPLQSVCVEASYILCTCSCEVNAHSTAVYFSLNNLFIIKLIIIII